VARLWLLALLLAGCAGVEWRKGTVCYDVVEDGAGVCVVGRDFLGLRNGDVSCFVEADAFATWFVHQPVQACPELL
jgi:hypothetical protein